MLIELFVTREGSLLVNEIARVLILDEDGQDGAEVAEAIAAELERAVAAGHGERAWA